MTAAAVLGSPIRHTLSPALHLAAYAELGLDWTYDVIDCPEAELPGRWAELAGTYAGLSLTMPLKRAVLPLLDRSDETVALVGACNTVVFGSDGAVGYNTDVRGVVVALAGLGRDWRAAVVLGGGGSARAVLAGLAEVGCGPVTVCLRDPGRGAGLLELGERLGLAVTVQPWAAAAGLARAVPLVVACTPAGGTDGLAASGWPAATALFDVLYAPWPTALGAAALAAGAPVVGGLPMLVAQAAEQVRLMTGRTAPVGAMAAAGEAALAAR